MRLQKQEVKREREREMAEDKSDRGEVVNYFNYSILEHFLSSKISFSVSFYEPDFMLTSCNKLKFPCHWC